MSTARGACAPNSSLLGPDDPLGNDGGVVQVQRPLWIDPPDQWENVDLFNYVALPAIGAQANVLSFQVPLGRNGKIFAIGNNFVGGGWAEGSGNVIWQVLVDGAPPAGAMSYDSILGSLGSPASPTRIAGFRIFENQILSLVVKNVNVVLAGQLSGGRILGYLYPREMEDSSTWL